MSHTRNPWARLVSTLHYKLTSQVETAEAKLNPLKARAEAAKTNVEIKAIAQLPVAKSPIKQVYELEEVRR